MRVDLTRRLAAAAAALLVAAAASPRPLQAESLPELDSLQPALTRQLAVPKFEPARFIAQPENSLAVLRWRFADTVTPAQRQAIADKNGADFLGWLLASPEPLEAYLTGGAPDVEGTTRGLEAWRDIFNADPDSRSGLWLRVAVATALAHSREVRAIADGSVIDPVARYHRFKKAHAERKLFPYFEQAPVWELRYVVNSWAKDEDLEWAIGTVTDPKTKIQEKIGTAAYMVPYRDRNAKGVSVQNGPEYYDHRPVTLALMVEVGGVCGAISRFGTSVAQAHGIPAMPFGQPGHCAFTWKTGATTWTLGNDISGWAGSSQHDGIAVPWGTRGAWLLLAQAARTDAGKFSAAEKLTWLAKISPHPAAMLESALRVQPLHGGAWQELTRRRLQDPGADSAQLRRHAQGMMTALAAHPMPLLDLLAPLEPALALKDDDARRAYVGRFGAALASVTKEQDHGTGAAALTELVKRVIKASDSSAGRRLEAFLRGDDEDDGPDPGARLADATRRRVQLLLESAMEATSARADLQDALSARYVALAPNDPQVAARAIPFFDKLFAQAKQNGDRKPAIALARRLIILAERAEDVAAAEKYSAECRRLLEK